MKIHSKAPTRIDLCGGTVDIWPLYLFLDQPTTLNLAIDLFAETTLTTSKKVKGVTLRAADQNAELKFKWTDLENVSPPPALSLHHRYLKHFVNHMKKRPTEGLILETRAKSPAGAGLGGSSTLSVSIIGALQRWAFGKFGVEKVGESLVEITRDVETTVIQVPAGLQDYYGAMFGGIQSLRWGTAKHARFRWPAPLIKQLEKRVTLFYSGQSRNSGINNWSLYKSFIDKDPKVQELFKGIVNATLDLEGALKKKNWTAVGEAIQSEWSFRRQLAAGITTPEIDRAFEVGKKFGASAGKICGAGGGGCFFLYSPSGSSEVQEKIIAEVTKLPGVAHLPFSGVDAGLKVSVLKANSE